MLIRMSTKKVYVDILALSTLDFPFTVLTLGGAEKGPKSHNLFLRLLFIRPHAHLTAACNVIRAKRHFYLQKVALFSLYKKPETPENLRKMKLGLLFATAVRSFLGLH